LFYIYCAYKSATLNVEVICLVRFIKEIVYYPTSFKQLDLYMGMQCSIPWQKHKKTLWFVNVCLVDLAGNVTGVDAVINKYITASNK